MSAAPLRPPGLARGATVQRMSFGGGGGGEGTISPMPLPGMEGEKGKSSADLQSIRLHDSRSRLLP